MSPSSLYDSHSYLISRISYIYIYSQSKKTDLAPREIPSNAVIGAGAAGQKFQTIYRLLYCPSKRFMITSLSSTTKFTEHSTGFTNAGPPWAPVVVQVMRAGPHFQLTAAGGGSGSIVLWWVWRRVPGSQVLKNAG